MVYAEQKQHHLDEHNERVQTADYAQTCYGISKIGTLQQPDRRQTPNKGKDEPYTMLDHVMYDEIEHNERTDERNSNYLYPPSQDKDEYLQLR